MLDDPIRLLHEGIPQSDMGEVSRLRDDGLQSEDSVGNLHHAPAGKLEGGLPALARSRILGIRELEEALVPNLKPEVEHHHPKQGTSRDVQGELFRVTHDITEQNHGVVRVEGEGEERIHVVGFLHACILTY